MKDGIMVSAICAAYNHEGFIKDCIEGVLNQKTDFKYELIIHDDASTDRTAELIKAYEEKYPQVMRPVYQKENQFFRCPIAAFMFPKAAIGQRKNCRNRLIFWKAMKIIPCVCIMLSN